MKSSDGVRMLKKAHMESEDTFDLNVYPFGRATRRPTRHDVMQPHSQMAIEEFEQRKLAAIMFTDMVGYSALTQRDEGLALELLEEHRTLLRPAFLKHQGQEVKTIDDGFLVAFASAVAAVNCAVELQEALARRNLGRKRFWRPFPRKAMAMNS
jgi:class 3 adenylate cyclase